jgi:pyruvate ferredoxin oxidoreductase alpha subunit
MAEALYNASGLGLPIVMTVANRAIGAPINIWNDHSDSMSQRDSGWIQLYVESNQEAVDTHVLAFRLAEEVSLPVMVCMDGFVLTHAFERLELPTQAQVDSFLPPFEPRQLLDPAEPVTIGAMVGTEAFTEVRYLAHLKQMQALDLIPELTRELRTVLDRSVIGLFRSYHAYDSDTVVIALGSVLGTIEDVVDELRAEGVSIGAVALKAFRPFPAGEVADSLRSARRVIVIERAFAIGLGGIVSQNVRNALAADAHEAGRAVYTAVAGLGGRPISKGSLRRLFEQAIEDELHPVTFVDLDTELVERELERTRSRRRSGPHAENMLRDVGVVAAGPV